MIRERVKAGMDRARKQGRPIGRPKVWDRRGFKQRFGAVLERLRAGTMSRRQAAKELNIGYATLLRLLKRPRSRPPKGGLLDLVRKEEKAAKIQPEGLTCIPQPIHCGATPEEEPDNETESLQLSHFYQVLAQVAMSVAKRQTDRLPSHQEDRA